MVSDQRIVRYLFSRLGGVCERDNMLIKIVKLPHRNRTHTAQEVLQASMTSLPSTDLKDVTMNSELSSERLRLQRTLLIIFTQLLASNQRCG